jgi:hypothetical protein
VQLQQQQQSIQQQQVIHQQQQYELQQQLVRQQKQQEDAHHQHYALIDRLRIDLEREREEKSHFQSLNRTITNSGEIKECVNLMDTADKLPPGQKSPKTGHANIEPTVILPMTSQNSSRVNSPSLNYVNNIQLSQPSQQPLPQPHQIHQQLQPQIQQQQLMQPLPLLIESYQNLLANLLMTRHGKFRQKNFSISFHLRQKQKKKPLVISQLSTKQ